MIEARSNHSAERPATVWTQCRFGGAQATLAVAAMHLTRHSTALQKTGSSWDRYMALNALRDIEDALAEFRAILGEASR